MIIEYEEIKRLVPQAFPFIMLDRVIQLEPMRRIVAVKNVTANEIFFLGHFPSEAIMPGAMILEGMAQAAIVLFRKGATGASGASDALHLFSSCKVRFLHPVVPGDQLRFDVKLRYATETAGMVEGVAMVEGRIVTKAEMVFGLKARKGARA